MTAMPEQAVLTRMEGGFDDAMSAVADLLISLGYHDVTKELRLLADNVSQPEDVEWL